MSTLRQTLRRLGFSVTGLLLPHLAKAEDLKAASSFFYLAGAAVIVVVVIVAVVVGVVTGVGLFMEYKWARLSIPAKTLVILALATLVVLFVAYIRFLAYTLFVLLLYGLKA